MSNEHVVPYLLSPEIKQDIDHWLTKYPENKRRSAIVPALLLVQKDNGGWLSDSAMNAVADYLVIDRIIAYENATFYDMFELKPVGRNLIRICTNISCQLRGSEQVVAHFKKRLGVGLGETSKDGCVTLRESECLGACGGAPMCQLNDEHYHENLTPDSIDLLLASCQQEEQGHE